MTKKYKIDFNNGKVFEAEKLNGVFHFKCAVFSKPDLDLAGATITEIEEPRRSFYIDLNKGPTFVMEGKPEQIDYRESGPFEFYQQIHKGEVIVSREKLAEAWANAHMGVRGAAYNVLCKELGLGE
jgi:hypothetical protein